MRAAAQLGATYFKLADMEVCFGPAGQAVGSPRAQAARRELDQQRAISELEELNREYASLEEPAPADVSPFEAE